MIVALITTYDDDILYHYTCLLTVCLLGFFQLVTTEFVRLLPYFTKCYPLFLLSIYKRLITDIVVLIQTL